MMPPGRMLRHGLVRMPLETISAQHINDVESGADIYESVQVNGEELLLIGQVLCRFLRDERSHGIGAN